MHARPKFLAAAVVVIAAISASTAGAQSDAITASRFSLTIDGYEIATFSELTGIVAEVEPAEYWESSGKNINLNKLAGKQKPPQITLKRGMNGSLELWAWHEAVRNGQIGAARRSCSLTMFNAEGTAVAKYFLENAWPSKIDISGLKAGASEVLIETVTLTATFIQRVSP